MICRRRQAFFLFLSNLILLLALRSAFAGLVLVTDEPQGGPCYVPGTMLENEDPDSLKKAEQARAKAWEEHIKQQKLYCQQDHPLVDEACSMYAPYDPKDKEGKPVPAEGIDMESLRQRVISGELPLFFSKEIVNGKEEVLVEFAGAGYAKHFEGQCPPPQYKEPEDKQPPKEAQADQDLCTKHSQAPGCSQEASEDKQAPVPDAGMNSLFDGSDPNKPLLELARAQNIIEDEAAGDKEEKESKENKVPAKKAPRAPRYNGESLPPVPESSERYSTDGLEEHLEEVAEWESTEGLSNPTELFYPEAMPTNLKLRDCLFHVLRAEALATCVGITFGQWFGQ